MEQPAVNHAPAPAEVTVTPAAPAEAPPRAAPENHEGGVTAGRVNEAEFRRVAEARARADAVTKARINAGLRAATVKEAAAKISGGSTSVNGSVVRRGPGRPPGSGAAAPASSVPAPPAAPSIDPVEARRLAREAFERLLAPPNKVLARLEVDAAPLGCQPGELVLAPHEISDLAEGSVAVAEAVSPRVLAMVPALALATSCLSIVVSRWIVYRRLDARANELAGNAKKTA